MGGYQIVDFKNVPLSPDEEYVIPGVYDSILNSNGKPLMLYNLFHQDVTFNSAIMPTHVDFDSGQFTLYIPNRDIYVYEGDIVMMTVNQ